MKGAGNGYISVDSADRGRGHRHLQRGEPDPITMIRNMPVWAAKPCSNWMSGDCVEDEPHLYHAKWWYRLWLRVTAQIP